MHIPPYENHNAPIVDVGDTTVPLNYFNIVMLKAGQAFEYQVPGYETCIVPATGTIDVSIEGVQVKVFSVAKTIADCFRHRRTVGQSVALEGLQEAIRQRKATASEIAHHAERGGVATVIRPYLEALTANG